MFVNTLIFANTLLSANTLMFVDTLLFVNLFSFAYFDVVLPHTLEGMSSVVSCRTAW